MSWDELVYGKKHKVSVQEIQYIRSKSGSRHAMVAGICWSDFCVVVLSIRNY
jgi:hypothetical protein